ncbi:hypothetical protein PRIC2_004223 [Phytophthora ramorum]
MWTLRRSLRRSTASATLPTRVHSPPRPSHRAKCHREPKFSKVGYFRPIQPSRDSSMADHHVDVMRQQLELSQDVEQLYGVTSSRAMEAMLTGKGDDVVEEILDRYEQCRKGHDFMIIEGSQISKHESAMSWKINVDIAKAIGSPVLMVTDFGDSSAVNGELLEEMVSRTLMGRDQADAAGLNYLGTIANRIIASKRLNEVTHQLGATQLFGNSIANDAVVTSAVVAASALKDLFAHLKKYKDGAMIITSGDRSDLMLGLMVSRLPGVLPNISAIVLTNGVHRHLTVEQLKIDRSKQLFDEFVEKEMLIGELDQGMVVNRSPKQFQHFLFSKSRAVQRRIVLTEGEDIRVLQAADQILRQNLSKITILGDPDEILLNAKTSNLDLSRANIVRPADSDLLEKYVDYFYEKRKHKGVTKELARDYCKDETYFGTLMVEMGDADGMVSGACHTTANTIRPALQLIKTTPNRPIVSSVFFMCLEDGVRIYGDCAVNTDPSAADLAQIAVTSAESAEAFGLIPKVALLSYATGDSNSGPIIDKVREATKIAQELRPDLDIYGPIQYDAAVDASIAKTKLKAIPSGAKVGGQANVLIFPDLNTGNNTYKAVQQSTGCVAMGPMLQGLRKPVNDLSRGATVKDIVTTVAITAIQADQVILKREATAKK